MKTFDYTVAGAGVVGLAAALELKKRKPSSRIAIFEKEPKPGLHASGRNSGVLHSGIYYPPDSLKAKVCSNGARLMREFAAANGIPIVQKGKLIVARGPEDLPVLEKLAENATHNKVRFEYLDEAGVKKIEPYASTYQSALFVADTAVIDAKQTVLKMAELAVRAGIEIHTGEAVLEISPSKKNFRTSKDVYAYSYFVNCAGAYADRIAAFFGIGRDFTLVPFKGLYYQLRPEKNAWVRSNIYPVPDPNMPFLGVHFTRSAAGEVYVGPTAIPAFGRENYGFLEGIQIKESGPIFKMLAKMYFAEDPMFRNLVHHEFGNYFKPVFFRRARKLLPALDYDDLIPCGKVGIRPQLVNRRTGKLEMDYILEQTPYSLHVLNAVSPAFTSAFAFAEILAGRITQ